MATCRTNIIGIRLVYCVDGEPKEMWVDLKKVHALAWCEEPVPAKPGNPSGNAKLPEDRKGPGKCPPAKPPAAVEPAICLVERHGMGLRRGTVVESRGPCLVRSSDCRGPRLDQRTSARIPQDRPQLDGTLQRAPLGGRTLQQCAQHSQR
ncbi:hypothetical protein BH23GEM9_BH23GEM9_07620 [soil metagenome]